jgi:hypothetical protein
MTDSRIYGYDIFDPLTTLWPEAVTDRCHTAAIRSWRRGQRSGTIASWSTIVARSPNIGRICARR